MAFSYGGQSGGGFTANRTFRILLETESGARYSWQHTSFVTSAETAVSVSTIASRIMGTSMDACEVIEQAAANPSDLAGQTYPHFSDNPWLSAEAVSGGSGNNKLGFTHLDASDSADPFLRVKFYGSIVCAKLGLAVDTWYFSSGFNLSVSDDVPSTFRGLVIADELTCLQTAYWEPAARMRGTMMFDVSGSEENTHGMRFVTGSAEFGFIGYDPVLSGSKIEVDQVRSFGDVVALYASDERLKDNIEYIIDPISKVNQLSGVEFEWNQSQKIYPAGTKDIGIIAQDLQKIYPELVSTGSNGYLGVKSYGKLAGLLIEAIKEQSKQITDLSNRIKKLENK